MKGRCLFLLSLVWLIGSAAILPAEVRTWTDNTGKFKTQAEYVSYAEGKVTLRKSDGLEVQLPLKRLSLEDQRYVQEHVREARAKEKAEREQAEKNGDQSADDDPTDDVTEEEEDPDDQPSPANRPPRPPIAEREEDRAPEPRQEDLEDEELDEEIDAELEEEDQPTPVRTARAVTRPPAPPVKANNVLTSVRGAVYRTETINNLRQIGLALVQYASEKDSFPSASTAREPDQGGLSWRVAILPYLGQNVLYRRFRMNEPWDSEHNRQLIPLMPKVFLSPGIHAETSDGLTNYLAPVSSNTVISDTRRRTRLQDIRDGTSKTIMVVEADDERAVIWTQPADLPWDPAQPQAGLGQIWPGHFFAALADGSCRRIMLDVGDDTLRGLVTRNGGEVVQLEE